MLGTVPSIASLTKQQYYGHPQNAFWPIMGHLFGAGRNLPYEERKRVLQARHLAVWDVLRECHREGSLDTSIRIDTEIPNDFVAFFKRHPRVWAIFFNGTKAESAFRRHALPQLARLDRDFTYLRLPSTSPAHAGRTFEQKLAAWQVVAQSLQEGS